MRANDLPRYFRTLMREFESPAFLFAVGGELRIDIRADTPVVTGRLKNSTYVRASGIAVLVGWETPYARKVERRRGVIASVGRNPDPAVGRAANVMARQVIRRVDARFSGTGRSRHA